MIGWGPLAAYKGWAYLVAAGLLFGLGTASGYKVRDYAARKQAARALTEALRSRDSAIAERDRAMGVDGRVAQELALFNGVLRGHEQTMRDMIAGAKLLREVTHENPDGTKSTCVERDPRVYRELFNAALDGPSSPE